MTTCKRPAFMVVRAIKSVQSQTIDDWELIIIDDSPSDYESRDEVKDAIASIKDDRIKYFQNERNIGACASRNNGIRMAKGDFVLYVDDDDELLPVALENKISKFDNPNVGLVYSMSFILDEKRNIKRNSIQSKHRGKVLHELLKDNFVYAFPMIRKQCFETCGLFDEEMLASQDYDLWIRIAKEYEFDYVDEPHALIHQHNLGRITTNPQKKISGYERLMDKNKDLILSDRHILHCFLLRIDPFYFRNKEYIKTIKTYVHALVLNPLDFRNNIKCAYSLIRIFFKLD